MGELTVTSSRNLRGSGCVPIRERGIIGLSVSEAGGRVRPSLTIPGYLRKLVPEYAG
jgi:hypothetical protein